MKNDSLEQLFTSLIRNRIGAEYFAAGEKLLAYLKDYLTPETIVGTGDSKTLAQLGVYELLREGGCRFLDKYRTDLSRKEKDRLYRDNFSADLFLSGINAVTLEGKIVNLDGNGSRVAPIIFGPGKVFLICGTNKIVMDDEEAIARIRNTAAPLDAQRLGKNTPCAKTGKCMDCRSVEKICNYHTIIQGQFDRERIRVLIVEGEYGY
ncbi:MAG: lactate utilization protein [Spirochaetales bacterium]|nr:lactate utilization protein [Spirochaetales bacterium]